MEALPSPRGAVSEMLLAALARPPHRLPHLPAAHEDDVRQRHGASGARSDRPPSQEDDVLADEDLQLALYLCYELHYRGLPMVDEGWEWEPSLLELRGGLERRFERALRELVPLGQERLPPEEVDLALRAIAEREIGPSLSAHIGARAGLEQVREFIIHRSAYQLKEADPHSWAIPRLAGAAKAALIEIQLDEYGQGRVEWMHAELFARTMRALGLDPTYGAYLEWIPAVTLATVNLMSLFGLHRRWRGAIVGHLALFEMTSSLPNARYAQGLRRLGFGEEATLFFDEHVTADAVHENIAAVDLAGGLVRQEPGLCPSLLWGARVLSRLEARWAQHLLGSWSAGRSSLRGVGDGRWPPSASFVGREASCRREPVGRARR